MGKFGQVLTAMVTPFDSNMAVAYDKAAELAAYLVDHGNDGLVVAGSTGEAATLTDEERLKLFETVLAAVGDRAYVIGGTGTNDTAKSVRLTKEAARIGLHGAMLVAPYYNKPSQEGLYRHFAAAAEAAPGLPIIVYNVPGRTGINLLPETVQRLAKMENIVAVKEASGNLEQMSEIIRTTPDDFDLYSGDDALTLPALAIGGCGIISVAGHIVGREIKAMITAFLAGELARARELHLKLLPVYRAMFIATNPTPVKAAVNMLGLAAGDVRLPLVAPGAADLEKIRAEMLKIGLPVKA
ncbi:4-hydroxy-tetrahydrodipicolinate synthase [Anaeroselena agilis]|uniref:4-hydroxy-tetrahydrodipicolinate synthase n=1 Tax=Anaeroselena agilis TaxID=3063788 RepID=A0ABU3P087_9FIRM|nr:4-hydroxy-tetrahydrodipicolinate synthase [Selenomonadales bacterium 4137-cl]